MKARQLSFSAFPCKWDALWMWAALRSLFLLQLLVPQGIQSRKSLPGQSEPLAGADRGVSLSSEAPALSHG